MKKKVLFFSIIIFTLVLAITSCTTTVTSTSNTCTPSTVTVPVTAFGEIIYWDELSRTVGAGVPGLSNVVAVASGSRQDIAIVGLDYGLALKSDGTVWYWAMHPDPQNYTDSMPVQIVGLSNITAISTGFGNSLALDKDGNVWDWGNNYFGQFGTGIVGGGDQPQGTTTTTPTPGQTTTTPIKQPVRVSDLNGVISISSGLRHCLALKSDGTVWAWGDNEWGQLGDGTTTSRYIPTPINNLTGVVAISAGHYHSLALKSDGTVWAWGDNESGELGTGDTVSSLVPVQVKGLEHVTVIADGEAHSLALKNDGTVWSWGNNENGQSGNGTVSSDDNPAMTRPAAVPFFNNGGVTAIAEGGMPGGSGVPGVKTLHYGAGYCLAAEGGNYVFT